MVNDPIKYLIKWMDFMVIEERKEHILSVRDFALTLAHLYGVEPRRVEVAALAHDLFRDVSPEILLRIAGLWGVEITGIERRHPVLLHGKVAAEFLRWRFCYDDKEVLNAVAYHTSGHPEFEEIGKILIVSDTVSYDRNFPDVEELRKIAFRNLETAYREVLKNRITYALESGKFLLEMSVRAWNKVVERR